MSKKREFLLEWCIDDFNASLPFFDKIDQIEWCSRLDLDGLTPDIEIARNAIALSPVPLKIMLRRRGGDFIYSTKELDDMIQTGLQFVELGFSRFVFGAIDKDRLDIEAIHKLCSALAPSMVCVHKAIDSSKNILDDLLLLGEIPGVNEVLSSGGAVMAMEGAAMLKEMHAIAPQGISIIGAGKITRENVSVHHEILGLTAYHGKRMA